MNNQRLTLLLLLGLSAAFETVDYDTLLNVLFHRLQFSFRIQGKVLSWFKSYFLLGRSEHVIINDIFSDEFSLECGVPQGSHTIYAVYEKALELHFCLMRNNKNKPRLLKHFFAIRTRGKTKLTGFPRDPTLSVLIYHDFHYNSNKKKTGANQNSPFHTYNNTNLILKTTK